MKRLNLLPDEAWKIIEYLTTGKVKGVSKYQFEKIKEKARKVKNGKTYWYSKRRRAICGISLTPVQGGIEYKLWIPIPIQEKMVEAMTEFYPYKRLR